MNKGVAPILLLILAVGIYFTFTKGKVDEIKTIKTVNAGYEEALENVEKLIKVRDGVLKTYNSIDEADRRRLDKIVPNNIDNVRLIIDVKGIGEQHGLTLRNVKTSAKSAASDTATTNTNSGSMGSEVSAYGSNPSKYETVTLSFEVAASYKSFVELLRSIESSLRILDISKISVTANETNIYDYEVELKTYWLKQ
jgi:Tfp pilus assembly protein PilO